jgi:hypothetical protein
MLKPTERVANSALVMAPRLASLQGKVIGTLWNNKGHGDQLLKQVGDQLRERYGVAEVVHRKKLVIASVAPNEVLQELRQKCDAVVAAIGD